MASTSHNCLSSAPNKFWSKLLFVVFSALYIIYLLFFIFTAGALEYGINISDVDTGYLIEAGMFYFWLSFLYIGAFLLLVLLYLMKTKAKRLAVAGVILPIVALHIARALITAYYPVTIH